MASINGFKAAQLILAILGLIFILTSVHRSYGLLVTIYVVTLVYILVILISDFCNKSSFSSGVQALIEILLAIFIVAYSIYVCQSCGSTSDTWLIMNIVIGFILAASLISSGYSKI